MKKIFFLLAVMIGSTHSAAQTSGSCRAKFDAGVQNVTCPTEIGCREIAAVKMAYLYREYQDCLGAAYKAASDAEDREYYRKHPPGDYRSFWRNP